MASATSADSASAIRERLHVLTDTHPQAEIARRTGFPPANVHRFLRAGKIPADFCSAVVREFGLNPAWLLTGEGAPHLSDVPEGTVRMAGNVLELVEAMSAVARMRLGSLTGKHHLRVLRDLSDALVEYDRLRQHLIQHSRPVFERLVKDIDSTLNRDNRDLERAGELLRAAEQVARLCPDDELSLKLDASRAFHAFLNRDFATSAAFRRRVFVRQMAGGPEFNEARLLDAQFFVMALLGTGHAEEALRVAKAPLDLATGPRGRFYAIMVATVGVLQLDLGDLRTGMASIHSAMPEAARLLREQYDGYAAKMQLCSGLQTVAECLHGGVRTRTRGVQLLRHACWLEDPGTLKLALEKCVTDKPTVHLDRVGSKAPDAALAQALLDAPKVIGKTAREAAVLARLETMPTGDPRDVAFAAIARTQLLRSLGRTKQGGKALADAESAIAAIDPAILLPLEYRAIHARNQLELAEGERREAGRRFYREHYANGFACYRGLVT